MKKLIFLLTIISCLFLCSCELNLNSNANDSLPDNQVYYGVYNENTIYCFDFDNLTIQKDFYEDGIYSIWALTIEKNRINSKGIIKNQFGNISYSHDSIPFIHSDNYLYLITGKNQYYTDSYISNYYELAEDNQVLLSFSLSTTNVSGKSVTLKYAEEHGYTIYK